MEQSKNFPGAIDLALRACYHYNIIRKKFFLFFPTIRLIKLILYIVRDKMYAEDILQDTYMKAIASLEQYRPGTNFAAWLCSIGRSLALNHVKKYRREVSADFEADAYRYGSAETPLPYVFDAAAKALDGEEYEIVMLCNVAGYKRREVAEMLGMPIGTVTWKNNRALEKLKEYLKEGGV